MNYRIEGLIGRGGMGVVYRATDLALQRPVALKLIAPELAQDERFRRRFLAESRLAASLDHASVVPVYEAGEDDGQLFLAMRYVEGSDLRALLPVGRERAFALLEQIASALDAAHRSGLVHRDVKPANILVDGDDHAYLTDFGVSKQLGGVTTDTGRMVGSLDYLAPEQIAGERVDPRTDQYALACVLYECLAGTPAFRRESEAETLWAHMQSQYAPLPGLERVFKRAFARDPRARYGTCAELIAAAREPRPARRGRFLVALAAVLAVTVLVRDGPEAPPIASGVVALGADGRARPVTDAVTAPSNLAVGEGALWVLDSDAETVARIDLATRAVRRFRAGPRPNDIAAGGGAVWIGNAARFGAGYTTDVSRVDPRSLKVTHTVKLAPAIDIQADLSEGHPQLAVGAGAVWAISLDHRVYRIDPASARVVARIPVAIGTRTIAAGAEGVWSLAEDSTVERIDPGSNRVVDRIAIETGRLSGIAVGGGAVWVTAPDNGQLWRLDPGARPRQRSIDVGTGVSFVRFVDGAAWVANPLAGTAMRVDARTNAVTTTEVGTAQAMVAGAGEAWVSVAGDTAPRCGPVEAGGVAAPDVLIASDLPLRGPNAPSSSAHANAIRAVLARRGFRAGGLSVGYRSCDDSSAQDGGFDRRRCAANARAYAHTRLLVAVIGPMDSNCAEHQISVLNRAPGGPLALVSPTNFKPDLTRASPEGLYPTGIRNYARVVAPADLQGVAHAVLAQQLRLSRVYLVDTRDTQANFTVTDPFRRAATRLGVGIVGAARFDRTTRSHAPLAERVARARPDGVVIAGYVEAGGARVIKALRARLGPRVAIMVTEDFGRFSDILEAAGPAARGVYVTNSEIMPDAASLTPAGKRFVAGFGPTVRQGYVLHAAQAAEVVLQAIARSDGTRASVIRALHSIRVRDGILGSFSFDRNGDMTPASVTIARLTGVEDARLPLGLQGAVVDRVVAVPAGLAN